jgi:hypothetical protein
MTITQTIPVGTFMRRESAPTEEFVITVADLEPGDTHATVRYFGSATPAFTWAEWVGNLVPCKFNAIAF